MNTFLIRHRCIVLAMHPLCRLVFSLNLTPPDSSRYFLLLSPPNASLLCPAAKHHVSHQALPRLSAASLGKPSPPRSCHHVGDAAEARRKTASEYGPEHHHEPNYVSSGYILTSVWGKAQEQTPWGSGELIVYWQSRQPSIDGVWAFWSTPSLDCQLIRRSQTNTTHGRMEV